MGFSEQYFMPHIILIAHAVEQSDDLTTVYVTFLHLVNIKTYYACHV